MNADPASAPPRTDLPFLRRRATPKPTPAAAAVSDFISGHATHTGPPHQSAAPAPAQAVSGSLDLSEAPAPSPAATPSSAAAPAPRVHQDRRVGAGERALLGITTPTVTLTRVQSGIGQLGIEAVCSPEVGDLRLGAAYQLRDGESSLVQYTGGNRFAPSSKRPVLVAGKDEYEHVRIDLRQVPELERLAVYAFSESRADLTWGGTLVVTTFGGARIELPLETLFAGKIAILLSIYNLDGELVIRAEMETITGDVREAARAYGYDRITWRDDRSPAG